MDFKKNNIRLYRNYFDFSCTGSECPDNCCRITTWDISMDKYTYRHFKQLDDEFAQVVLNSVQYNEKDDTYTMKPSEFGSCAMLNQQGLCEIHKRFDSDHLPFTCAHYPKNINGFNGILEWGLASSCPVVVDQFIMNGKFELQDYFENFDSIATLSEPTSKSRIAFQTQKTAISLLQTPDIALYDKLLWLNLLFRVLSKESLKEDNETNIYNVLNLFQNERPTADTFNILKREIENTSANTLETYYTHWWHVLKSTIKIENKSPQNLLYEKIKSFHNMDVSKFYGNTITLKNKLLIPYKKENEQVFENYLVKDMFDTQFPLSFDNFESAYISFLSNYILLQLWILALYHDQESITSEDVRNAIYYFHRKVSHSPSFLNFLIEYYENNENINWATLASLLY